MSNAAIASKLQPMTMHLSWKHMLAGPDLLFMSSIGEKNVVASRTMVSVDSAVLMLGDVIEAICIAGPNIVLLLQSGEMRIYSDALQLLTSRQVAIPGEWNKPPLLAASAIGSTIAVGLAGNALVVYSYENEALQVLGSVYLAPFVTAVSLITVSSSTLPVIWTFSKFMKDKSFIKVEPCPGAGGDLSSTRLPLQGDPLFALTLESTNGACLVCYDDHVKFVSIQDIISGRTSPKCLEVPKVTAWSAVSGAGPTKAYLVSKSTLRSVTVVDGQVNLDILPIHDFDIPKITHFNVLAGQGKLRVEYSTDLERGRFFIDAKSGEVSGLKVSSRYYKDFDFNLYSGDIITRARGPPGLVVLLQSDFVALQGEFKDVCPPFVTELFYIAEAGLLIVNSLTKAWFYYLKSQPVRLIRTVEKPVLAAFMSRDSLLIATDSGVAALGIFQPHNTIMEQKLDLSKVSMAHGLCVAVFETNEVALVDLNLNRPPQKFKGLESLGMVYFAKPLSANTVAIGFEKEIRFYDPETMELERQIVTPETASDCLISDGELILATVAGNVIFPTATKSVAKGPISFMTSGPNKPLLVKAEQLYFVDLNGSLLVNHSNKVVLDKVKAACSLDGVDNECMVATGDTILKIQLDSAVVTTSHQLHVLPLTRKAEKIIQVGFARAMFVLTAAGGLVCFDSKHYKRLTLEGLHNSYIQDMCIWTKTNEEGTFSHLVIVSKQGKNESVMRSYVIQRKRQTLTLSPRIKKDVGFVPISLVSTSDWIACRTEVEDKSGAIAWWPVKTEQRNLKVLDCQLITARFSIYHVAAFRSYLYITTSCGFFVRSPAEGHNQDVDLLDPDLAVACAPTNGKESLIHEVNGELFIFIACKEPYLVILHQTSSMEFQKVQNLALPDCAAKMHISQDGALVILLQNSSFIRIDLPKKIA